MGRFLFDSDYSSIIQAVDLAQITEGVNQNLLDSEAKAISRMRTKLVQRYVVDIELGGNDAYSASKHYRSGERVLATTIYYVKSFDQWSKTKAYVVGDKVCDSNYYVYTCIANSQTFELTNTTYWSPMVNIVQTNATYWTNADNRYPMFVELAMDMALYNAHARINPRNIPDLRIERNREALDQLDRWASGTDTAEVLNVLSPEGQGVSITWGASSEKQTNNFM
jgi:hypothetical protein